MNHFPTKAAWRKSTFCNGADACVEVAFVDGYVAVRDSKEQDGPVLLFGSAEWEVFTAGVKAGEFDLAALTVSAGDGSGVDGRSEGSGVATAVCGGGSVPA